MPPDMDLQSKTRLELVQMCLGLMFKIVMKEPNKEKQQHLIEGASEFFEGLHAQTLQQVHADDPKQAPYMSVSDYNTQKELEQISALASYVTEPETPDPPTDNMSVDTTLSQTIVPAISESGSEPMPATETQSQNLQPPAMANELAVRKRKDNTDGKEPPAKRARVPSKRKTSHKPLQVTKRLTKPEELADITVGMNQAFTVTNIQQIRSQFYDALMAIPYPQGSKLELKEGQDPAKMYDIATATQVTHFFFHNMMGPSAIDQIREFVQEYTPDVPTKTDFGAVNRLRKTAVDPKAPRNLRLFCASLSAELAQEAQKNLLIARIENTRRAVNTFTNYQTLSQDIEENAPAIWAYITEILDQDQAAAIRLNMKGSSTTSQGRTNVSVVRDALCAVTGIDRNILNSRIENARMISHVVDRFGQPVILLLPESSEGYFKNVSKARLVPACDLLEKLCPFIPEIVKVLDKHIWQPYIAGARQLPVNTRFLTPTEDTTNEIRMIEDIETAAANFDHDVHEVGNDNE